MRLRNLDGQVTAARLLPIGPERDARLKQLWEQATRDRAFLRHKVEQLSWSVNNARK